VTPNTGLTVWLYGQPVATVDLGLHAHRDRLRLVYRKEAFETFDEGTPLLSLHLPIRADPYPNAAVRSFIDGLLPEGDVRRAIAEELGLRAGDTYGLITALGRDCAGALVIQPDNEVPPSSPTTMAAEPIDAAELESLVANLRSAPLGVSDRVRLSLAGVQEKLLLTRMCDGRWGRPIDGTPSTHILKPELREYPHTVANEAFCMRLANVLNLPTARIETTEVGQRPVLIVERYDRVIGEDGTVERVHQEDFCQAMGLPPSKKYQAEGGPSLRQIARMVDNLDPEAVENLLRAVTLNIIIGNADAHGKNFSLVHSRSGAIRLAPLYDLLSIQYYGLSSKMSMYVDSVQVIDRVTQDRIVNEAVSWGVGRRRAEAVVHHVLDRMPDAVVAAADKTSDLPAEIPDIALAQLRRVKG